jgi:hypothetical protein
MTEFSGGTSSAQPRVFKFTGTGPGNWEEQGKLINFQAKSGNAKYFFFKPKKKIEEERRFPLAPMGVLTCRSVHTRPSA